MNAEQRGVLATYASIVRDRMLIGLKGHIDQMEMGLQWVGMYHGHHVEKLLFMPGMWCSVRLEGNKAVLHCNETNVNLGVIASEENGWICMTRPMAEKLWAMQSFRDDWKIVSDLADPESDNAVVDIIAEKVYAISQALDIVDLNFRELAYAYLSPLAEYSETMDAVLRELMTDKLPHDYQPDAIIGKN